MNIFILFKALPPMYG